MRVGVNIPGSAYDVHIRADFDGLARALADLFPRGTCIVVSNPVVAPLYAAGLVDALMQEGWSPIRLDVPDGEAHKDLVSWADLVDRLLEAKIDRRTPVLALGGGVIGDLVGYAAASVLRGVPLVQVPTTLLAMVDSSVGGKTGVNARQGKNLVGAFHQPVLVWAALHTLQTLPGPELRSGLGEVVKHALIAGEEAFRFCEHNARALREGDPAALAVAVADSVRIKAAIVAEDPLEQGRRAVLNLGHTLGHALERTLGFGEIRHGEAVALGLLAIARWSLREGLSTDPSLPERLEALLVKLKLPLVPPPGLDRSRLVAAVAFDKKRARGSIRVVLPYAPGQIVLHELPLERVPSLVESLFPPSEDRC